VGDTADRSELRGYVIGTFPDSPTTRFNAEQSALEPIRHRLKWAARQRLIRSFTCEASFVAPFHLVVIQWWDPIDEPVKFTRAHVQRGTGSA
jgi:hypothetical protein